jgi:predicted ABC-type ATPase
MTSNLYIIAEPNGAGKTTFAKQFLPNYADCREFVNADLIAGGLSPFSPNRAAIQAGRLMLERIRLLASRSDDFGFETTLAGKAFVNLIKSIKKNGYRIHIFFLWIQSVDIALARIADRVRRGGHAVDENVVRRRYTKSISNFFYRYRPLGDYWAIFDNSTDSPSMIACEESGKIKIYDQYLFYEISHVAGKQ